MDKMNLFENLIVRIISLFGDILEYFYPALVRGFGVLFDHRTISPEKPKKFPVENGFVIVSNSEFNICSSARIYESCRFISVRMCGKSRQYWLTNKIFKNCTFEKCDFTYMADHGNLFESCVFDHVDFRYSILGYDNSKFINCKFIRVRFFKIFHQPTFENCIFENCYLKNIDFNGSVFNNVTFIGKLENVWFRGQLLTPSKQFLIRTLFNEMKNVSFKNASLRMMTYSDNCKLSSVILPEKGSYAYFGDWHNQLESAYDDFLKIKGPKDDSSIFYEIFNGHKEQNEQIINIDEVRERWHSNQMADLLLKSANKLNDEAREELNSHYPKY